jgi:hypothetical protein
MGFGGFIHRWAARESHDALFLDPSIRLDAAATHWPPFQRYSAAARRALIQLGGNHQL